MKEKSLNTIGRTGTGFNMKTLEDVYKKLKRREQKKTLLIFILLEKKVCIGLNPVCVADITFSNWTD